MPDNVNQVCPKTAPDKSDVSAALSVSWARTAQRVGKGTMADKLRSCTKTIDRALTGDSVPELHTALASLLADPNALDEVFALYGFDAPRRRNAEAANDMATVSDLSGLVATFCDALKDGHRDHRETLAIADLVRAIMPSLTDILDEANALRGVKAA
jgi:hypothetical protein